MNLIDRAQRMIVSPKSEWLVVAPEQTTPAELYRRYVVPLAAIGAIAGLVGTLGFGARSNVFGGHVLPASWTVAISVLKFGFALFAVYITALLVDAFAPQFGGEKNPMQALKIAAFSTTPYWVAGILLLFPRLGGLAILAGFYSIYVMYLGLPVLMRAPVERASGYTAAVIVCAVIVEVVLSSMLSAVSFIGVGGPHIVANIAETAIAESQRRRAQATAGFAAKVGGAATAPSASAVGPASVDPVDQATLKALLPETVGGLARKSVDATRSGVAGTEITKADARYTNDKGPAVDLTVTDMAGTQMLGALAAWSHLTQDRESPAGYEKMAIINGRPVHEIYDKDGSRGEYTIIVADRFIVEADGSQVDMAVLKAAVGAIDLAKLENFKASGSKSR